MQNAVLSLNKMWNEDTNAKKEKKKEFWQWVLWDLFFFLNITPWVRIASLFRLSTERDSPRLPGSNERSDSWQNFLQPVWQTLFCSTGPFHWVSAKAVGIMDTSLYEAWCMNNGLFVCFPVHVVHVFHNQARTITLCVCLCVCVCLCSMCLLSVMLSSLMLWVRGPGACRVVAAGCLDLFFFFCFEDHLWARPAAEAGECFRRKCDEKSLCWTLL